MLHYQDSWELVGLSSNNTVGQLVEGGLGLFHCDWKISKGGSSHSV